MPVPLSSITAGVIGTGFIGPVHIEALKRLGVNVAAVCGSNESAVRVAERFGISRAIGGYDFETLIGAPDIDVVHVTSPNRQHYAQALAALQAGKHCICEKPLAMNSRETAALVKAAAKSGKVFAVNYNVRFYPAVLQMRAMVARGELGDIIHVQGSYLQDWLLKDTDYSWRLLPEEGGTLRAVADIGTHWLDTVSFILGSPIVRVLADLGTYHQQRKRPVGELKTFAKASAKTKYETYDVKTEDFAYLLLGFANGARGGLAVSQVAAGRKNCIRIEIYGSKQSAWWSSEDPDKLHLGRRDQANATAFRACAEFGDAAGYTDYPGGHVEGFPDSFKMLFRSVYTDIAAGRPGSTPAYAVAADGHEEMRLCEAIMKSHRSERWVKP
ncbi:MAG TPA: Gfo/Idh/MocA family oxidoreductase [Candidatus Limnocylindria bacterium]|jgi:predicted dehydrogenase|nr:Gfo/Idh/MocA family oxidoreductase [Candidatus Limnocylindria bacterium]